MTCKASLSLRAYVHEVLAGWLAVFAAPLTLMPCSLQEPLDVMLSRGIDPDVTDPSKCHSHPEVPKRWPTRPELQVRTLCRASLALYAVTSKLSLAPSFLRTFDIDDALGCSFH